MAGEAAPIEPARDIGGIGDTDPDELLDNLAGCAEQDCGEVAVQAASLPGRLFGVGQLTPMPKLGSTALGESITALA
ncbi:hypothetical protein [Bosea psychrotolerans]|uniref:Uncharacterized protein n=1 Tax=Bosea psychrotolerans TaxID=1871628 RepID=A0A2S4MPW9_9HYPH|nr:hypothetical protein [Bosea psychrotolerans]POR56800.1 hypothetical protein CYD53_101322 [Bosea psychrotolerans]